VFRIKPRAQNVPKTKVEQSKVVEITEDRKKVLMAENIDEVLPVKEEITNLTRKFPSWKCRFDPGRPLQTSYTNSGIDSVWYTQRPIRSRTIGFSLESILQ